MPSETALRLSKVEALLDLARSRLRPPERERVVGLIEAALGEARRAAGSGATDAVVRRAEEKAAQAAADRDEKRRPYEADPLFMYLWRRGFGTRDYRASNLVRYLDRKVAHLIGYEAARVNYAMLLELPERLREHVERLKQERAAGAGEPDDPRLAAMLAAVERQPEVAALVARASADAGADEALLRRMAELDRALNAAGRPAAP
ncbi:MAG TPA: hypothetical protein VHG30_18895 [Microvirga sp.]|nr:hypothetical protein [Microvirga sp.]